MSKKEALIGVAAGSLVTLLLTRAQEARAAGPPNGIDPAIWEMSVATMETAAVQAEQMSQLNVTLNNLVVAMGGAPAVEAGDPFENTDRFVTGHVVCTALNQGFQLPSFPVPKNKQLVVKADPGNVGWIYIGLTQGISQNLTIAYPLIPNEAVGLFINNSDRVWVTAPAPPVGALNDEVVFIVETE